VTYEQRFERSENPAGISEKDMSGARYANILEWKCLECLRNKEPGWLK
jgi:hypothetical protein